MHFPGPSGSVSRAPQGHCPRWALSLLGSWPQAVTLLANGNCPGSWEDMVKDWQPAHSLAGDADSGVDCSSPLPSTSGCHTCLSGSMAGGHKRQQAYFPLVFNMVWSFVLWGCRRGHCGLLEPSRGKGPLFFFVSLVFQWFGFLCHMSPLRLSSGHSSLVLRTMYVAHASVPSPHLRLVAMSIWAASLLIIAVCMNSVVFFFSFGNVALWDFQSSPLTQTMRGFPIVWTFLLLHDSLPRMSLCP